jgi:hypothetical protein
LLNQFGISSSGSYSVVATPEVMNVNQVIFWLCSRPLTEINLQDVNNDVGGIEVLKAHDDNNVARLPSAEEIHELLIRELNVLKQNFSNKAINKRNMRSSY